MSQHIGGDAQGALLLRRDAGGVAWLTLNRPAARNALSSGLMALLPSTKFQPRQSSI